MLTPVVVSVLVPVLATGFCAAALTACLQKLDPNAAKGSLVTGTGPGTSVDHQEPPASSDAAGAVAGDPGGKADGGRAGAAPAGSTKAGGDAGPGASRPAFDPCVETIAHARNILATNCAHCHEAPAKQGNFDFCLDFDTLITAVSSTGKHFVVPGAPDDSRLYQRVSAGEMPPPERTPRPTEADVVVLRDWITGCLTGMHATAPPDDAGSGTGGDSQGAPEVLGPPPDPTGCGKPGQACCTANVCNGGGCCVLGVCRASGQSCGASGEVEDDNGLPGTCTNGSCRHDDSACGNVAQPCCGKEGICTASRASCLMGTMCQACGGLDQGCCGGAATCVAGLDCQGNGFGRVGACKPCGGMGQPCCGDGPVANQTCSGGLACSFVAGVGDRCGS